VCVSVASTGIERQADPLYCLSLERAYRKVSTLYSKQSAWPASGYSGSCCSAGLDSRIYAAWQKKRTATTLRISSLNNYLLPLLL